MTQESSRQLLFVVGMHRSGTSALCAALAAAGASFGGQLLAPMSGVNDEGFWEDEHLVEINEALLAGRGCHWYNAFTWPRDDSWLDAVDPGLRERAAARLQEGFGEGLEAVKDPRLCLTLPFWLSLCEELGIEAHCCLIERDSMEVAASLARRDGFPLGFGAALARAYSECAAINVPASAPHFSYEDLLADPAAVIEKLATRGLPLEVVESLSERVRPELRNQRHADIEAQEPESALLETLAEAFVERGKALTQIGDQHSVALETLAERDADVEKLGAELQASLATVAERDEQINELDRRLAEAGDHLGKALATLSERDEQIVEFDRRLNEIGQMHSEALAYIDQLKATLERVFEKPVTGRLFRRAWSSEDPEQAER